MFCYDKPTEVYAVIKRTYIRITRAYRLSLLTAITKQRSMFLISLYNESLLTRPLISARNGPERTGTAFRFVKCKGITVPFRPDKIMLERTGTPFRFDRIRNCSIIITFLFL